MDAKQTYTIAYRYWRLSRQINELESQISYESHLQSMDCLEYEDCPDEPSESELAQWQMLKDLKNKREEILKLATEDHKQAWMNARKSESALWWSQTHMQRIEPFKRIYFYSKHWYDRSNRRVNLLAQDAKTYEAQIEKCAARS